MQLTSAVNAKFFPGNYTLASVPQALSTPEMIGAKVGYHWGDLEKTPGAFDFSLIDKDLNALAAKGKKLFIFIRFATFNFFAAQKLCAPDYIHKAGGVQIVNHDDKSGGAGIRKCIALVYRPQNVAPMGRLIKTLGARYDNHPAVAGLILPETAGAGGKGEATPAQVISSLKYFQQVAKAAFPRSEVLQAANWITGDDSGMVALLEHAVANGCGVSGPDLGRDTTAVRYYPKLAGRCALGMDNQRADLVAKDGPAATYAAVRGKLKLNYAFWGTNHGGAWKWPAIVPVIRAQGNLVTAVPANRGKVVAMPAPPVIPIMDLAPKPTPLRPPMQSGGNSQDRPGTTPQPTPPPATTKPPTKPPAAATPAAGSSLLLPLLAVAAFAFLR